MFRPTQLVAAALLALSATLGGAPAGLGATPAPDDQAIDADVSRRLAGAAPATA